MTERVVITGLGVVSPLGTGTEALNRLFAGESGIRPVESFDPTGRPCRLAAEVRDFEPREFINLRNLRKMDPISSRAVAAGRMALADSGLEIGDHNRDRVGILLGVSYGSVGLSVKLAETIFTVGPRQANPIIVPNVVMNAPAGHMAIELGLRGINSTVNHNAASAETALIMAAEAVRSGRAEAMLAGGTDILDPFFHQVLIHYQALSGSRGGEEAARPFDRQANGFVPGEGAGLVLLEPLARAQARGAPVFGEILGWGLTSSAASITDWPEDPGGPIRAVHRALDASGLAPRDIDLVWASANGAPRLDRLEAAALEQVFGLDPDRPRITSVKGALGESFSSGGLRAAAAAFGLRQNQIPPTLGLTEPIRPLGFVVEPLEDASMKHVLITGLSAGGTHAALVLGR